MYEKNKRKGDRIKMLEEFYPTPVSLLDKVFEGFNWNEIKTVLEPSAGKGDIADYIQKVIPYRRELDIDCIEKEDVLRKTLIGKGYRVVHDDFLTYRTQKTYDLIVMNPPFSMGATHLTKALKMQKYGGNVICILNADTIKNPYTNERKQLVTDLNKMDAQIDFLQDEFLIAERPTKVEIAVIKVSIPTENEESYFFSEMKKKEYANRSHDTETYELADSDIVKAAVRQYNIEIEAGIALMREYERMKPHIMNHLTECKYAQPILEIKVNGKSGSSINGYVRCVRNKYWQALFENPVFTKGMTSNLRTNYSQRIHELIEYDFSEYNIRTVQVDIMKHMVKGIEDCIMDLFEEFTQKHAWYPECQNNIHYYTGWATNKAWIINKKVIIPLDAFRSCSWKSGEFRPTYYDTIEKLSDIEKALDYLDGGRTMQHPLGSWLQDAERNGQTKNISLKYFTVTFYKKGTCHIVFKDDELLKKFNIFAARQNNWLPQDYGRKHYRNMTLEERKVIDSFEGSEENYEATLSKADYYLYNPETDVLKLEVCD